MSDLPETAWQSGWRTVRRLAPFLWPADDADSRRRVALALAALLLAKLATVATPVFFKAAVDGLAPAAGVSTAWYSRGRAGGADGVLRADAAGRRRLHPAARRRSSPASASGRCG